MAPPQVVLTKLFPLFAPDAVQLATGWFVATCSAGWSQKVSMKLGDVPPAAVQLATAVRGFVMTVLHAVVV